TVPVVFAQEQSPATHHHEMMDVNMALFPARDASGTAWQPDDTPMFGAHRSWGGWDVMLHGTLFVQWLYEPNEIHRTGGFSTHQLGSVNWGMFMARRPLGTGRVGFRAMLSGEPWTLRD